MDTETAILNAAASLLEAQGLAGLTTRAVCDATGVKAPTLYHHFGDKEGLQLALIRRGVAEFMQRKRAPQASADPLLQLRFGWDVAVDFALERPALYELYAQQVRSRPEFAADSYAVLLSNIQRLADAGRLRQPADMAAKAVWAASQGVLSLVRPGVERKEVEPLSDLLFNAVVGELTLPAAVGP